MTRSFAAAVGALSLVAAASAVEWDQQWRLKPSGSSSDRVNFAIERSKPGSRWVHSSDIPLNRFRGLTVQDLSQRGPAVFEFAGDAGRLICEGQFNGSGGSGTFTFAADSRFAGQLQSLGYDTPVSEDLLSLMLADVTLEFARRAREGGVASTTRELLDMKVHGVTTEYLDGMRASGYPGLRARDYIEMRIHGVTPDLVRELKDAGYDVPSQQIVQMRIHGVKPEYVRELRSLGLRPAAAEVVEMRIHGVTPDYLKGMTESLGPALTVRDVVNMRVHGVPVEFAKEAAQLGYRFTAKELTDLRIHGVSGAYLRRLKESGYRNLTAQNIVRLKVHGID
jgi:hypothetical protein